ncbi:chloride channel protein [Algiphilus sp.]|uniref:chloride channel protein n=1 Tax=Algiphilus sp. TaxID=1872431 RepID=UPI0025BE8FB5|nr:chloride channel protein [Algiphilus sp.]MCK5770550.1 chloride channel protein [Algiphilus sp.]
MGDRQAPARTDGGVPGVRRIAALVALGAVSGVLAAVAANAFVAVVGWLNELLLISPRSRVMETDARWVVAATLAVPIVGGLAVGLLHRAIGERRAHGPAEIIATVQTRSGHLPGRPALLSGLSALAALGSGASVGQYGPLVHMGGSLGSAMARLFRTGVTSDNFAVACGVAAAISTAFNAPIAGILFAHEVILRHFALRAFAPIAVASILGYVVAHAILPQPPLFQIDAAEIRHLWEFGPFLLLGVACALVAVGYMHAILGVARLARRLPLPVALRPALAGAGVGLMALWMPDILGIGSETLRFAFIDGAYGDLELLVVLLLKVAATALCLGMGFSGGVFSPALVIGSLFGAFFGTVMAALTGGATSALVVYAVCGMVAVTAPVIGAPLTTVVIVLELTGSYPLTIAALASVALANLVASRLFGRSFFDYQLRARGLDLSGGRSRALLASRSIADIVTPRFTAVPVDRTVAQARTIMQGAGVADASLLDDAGHYMGTLRLQDLLGAPDTEPAVRLQDPRHLIMTSDTRLWDAMQALRDFVGERVPVVDGNGRLVGTVVESDLIRAYLDLMGEMREEEHGTR